MKKRTANRLQTTNILDRKPPFIGNQRIMRAKEEKILIKKRGVLQTGFSLYRRYSTALHTKCASFSRASVAPYTLHTRCANACEELCKGSKEKRSYPFLRLGLEKREYKTQKNESFSKEILQAKLANNFSEKEKILTGEGRDFLSNRSNPFTPHNWVADRKVLLKKSLKIQKIESFFIKQFKDLFLQKSEESDFRVIPSQEKDFLSIEKKNRSNLFPVKSPQTFFRFGFSFEQIISKSENLQSGIVAREARPRSSAFKHVLKSTQKLGFLYGKLKKRNLYKIISKAKTGIGYIDLNLLSLLERRLDVSLKRAGFFSSRLAAKSMIRRGCVEVNKKKVSSPGYLLVPGDFVTVIPKRYNGKDFDKLANLSKNEFENFPKKERESSSEKREFFEKISNFFTEKLKALFYSHDYLLYFLKEKFSNKRIENKLDRKSFRFKISPFLLSSLQKLLFSFASSARNKPIREKDNFSKEKTGFLSENGKNKNWSLKLFTETQSNLPDFTKTLDKGLYYLLELKKQLVSYNLPLSDFSTEKSSYPKAVVKKNKVGKNSRRSETYKEKQQFLDFYKDKTHWGRKQTKPLHLEISYKSLSFIVLYPVQRIYFSNILDLSSIINKQI